MRAVAALIVVSLFAVACATGAAGASAAPVSAAAGGGAPGGAGAAASSTLGEQRSEGGAVEVVAAWASTDPPSLKLTMDTHSVDLDRVDLVRVATLRLDGGGWIAPTRAEVPNGGHHRAGTLTFGSVASSAFGSARIVELRIVDVGVPERVLRWERAG